MLERQAASPPQRSPWVSISKDSLDSAAFGWLGTVAIAPSCG